METVTISSDFQVEIPRRALAWLGIQPEQKIQVLLYNDRMEFIPVKRISEIRDFLERINPDG